MEMMIILYRLKGVWVKATCSWLLFRGDVEASLIYIKIIPFLTIEIEKTPSELIKEK